MIPLLNNYKEKWQVESANEIKPGLASMQAALALLQQPERAVPIIHIAGTNGKGSTLAFIEEMALAHGLKVGKFTSPCIHDVHDQIQINAQPISEAAMDEVFGQLQAVSGLLTDFELLTCAAFVHFARENVDVALIEAGMGGRFDSTNVVVPAVSIIPSIALEHTNFLGATLADIASHKAGIVKTKVPVVVGRLQGEALAVVKQEAADKKAPLTVLGEQIDVKLDVRGDCYYNNEEGLIIPSLKRQLVGAHQADNVALAVTAFLQFAKQRHVEVDIPKIRQAVLETQVPGRFEEVRARVIFDGAHNPASAAALAQTIRTQYPNARVEIVMGMLADKDISAVLRVLEPVADTFYFVDMNNLRAAKAEQLVEMSRATKKQIVDEPLVFLQQPVAEGTVRIVTGSLYLLSELRQQLEI